MSMLMPHGGGLDYHQSSLTDLLLLLRLSVQYVTKGSFGPRGKEGKNGKGKGSASAADSAQRGTLREEISILNRANNGSMRFE
jgi:hypothetical protein